MKHFACRTALALVCLSGSALAASEVDYELLLDELWTRTDADGSGALNIGEFTDALEALNIPASTFTSHGETYEGIFAAVDGDNSGGVTKSELADAAGSMTEYTDAFMGAFTNGALEPPSADMLATPADIKASRATVTYKVGVSGPPNTIFAGDRAAIKSYLAGEAQVSESAVVVTYMPVARRRLAGETAATSHKRELQAPTATEIDATMFVADAAAAEALSASLPATTTELTAVPAFESVGVTSVTPAAPYSVPPLPLETVGIIAGVLLVAFVLLMGNACLRAKKTAKNKGRAGGCCSLNAVFPWAFGELVACAAIVGTVVYLYTNATGVTDAIVGLIEFLIALVPMMDNPALASVGDLIPPTITDQLGQGTALLEQARGQFGLLPIAIMVPGLLAAFFLALGAICPVLPYHKGSYCWSKVYMFLALLLLVIALIFYILFAAVAVLFAFAPPALQDQIATIRGMCVSIPAQIGQQVTDGQAMITQLGGESAVPADVMATLDSAEEAHALIVGGCGSLMSLIDELIAVFVPAVMCVVAIVFAVLVNETLCFAAGCCCYGPSSKVEVKTNASEKDPDNLQSV